MKKGLSLLLAASMAVSAFSTAALAADELTAQEKFDALVEAGIFTGMPGGDPAFEQEMTRAQVAAIVARLLGLEENAAAAAAYTDLVGAEWAAGYIGAVTPDYMEGYGSGKFGPSDTFTFEQLATVLVRVLDLEVDADATVDGAVSDWAAGYVAAVVNAGIITPQADYTVPALREALVLTAYEAAVQLDVLEEQEAVVEFGAQATGAKKITVNFGKAVNKDDVTFAVKKGTINLNVSSATFSDDNTSAVLELSSKLTEGDYTVTVSGVSAEAQSTTFSAQNERVTKIEFLTTVAPLVDVQADNTGDLEIPYQVSNQYGEDITKTTSVIANPGSTNNGKVQITGSYKIGDVVAVTIVHAETATSAVATFTVAAEAKAAEAVITGLYNKDDKELNEDTNLATDNFYLVVEAKDQYGAPVTNTTKLNNELIRNQSNNTIVNVGAFETLTIDGVDKTVLPITAPSEGIKIGQNLVTLISNTTGKSASFTIVVSEAVRADVINLLSPGPVYVDEDAFVPVEAFDKDGNLIKSVGTLNHETKGVKVTVNGAELKNAFVLKDDIIQIKVPKTNAALQTTGFKPVIAMTSSNKVQTLNLDVKEKAVPTVIRGVDSDYGRALKTGKSKDLKVANLAIEDQYGRLLSDSRAQALLDGTTYRVRVADTDATVLSLDSTTLATKDGVIKINAGAAKGTEKITMVIQKYNTSTSSWEDVSSSSQEVNFRVTDGTEYASYTVDAIKMVYDEVANGKTNNSAYDKTIKVYGVLSDGSKVQLDVDTEYTVAALSNSTVNGDVYDSVLHVTSAVSSYKDVSEVVVPVTVTINKTGERITQDVTFSKASPKVASVKFIESQTTLDKGAAAKTDLTISTTTFNVSDLVNNNIYQVVVEDQYGVKEFANRANGQVAFQDGTNVTAVTFTVTPVTGTISIANNGKFNASVSGLDNGEEFDVTVTYAGGASATVRVKVSI